PSVRITRWDVAEYLATHGYTVRPDRPAGPISPVRPRQVAIDEALNGTEDKE
ncbi:unnamed protein product, partial [marine sediment metagenome]